MHVVIIPSQKDVTVSEFDVQLIWSRIISAVVCTGLAAISRLSLATHDLFGARPSLF